MRRGFFCVRGSRGFYLFLRCRGFIYVMVVRDTGRGVVVWSIGVVYLR